MTTSIYGMIYDELDAKIKHLPKEYGKYQKVFDALDREAIGDIILDGDVYWFEWAQYHDTVSDKTMALLKQYINQKGYRYMYDIPEIVRG